MQKGFGWVKLKVKLKVRQKRKGKH